VLRLFIDSKAADHEVVPTFCLSSALSELVDASCAADYCLGSSAINEVFDNGKIAATNR
jgi:hypothetical protein